MYKLFDLQNNKSNNDKSFKKKKTPLKRCDYSSVELQNIKENHSKLNVVHIKICQVKIASAPYFLVYVTDASQVQTFGLSRIQKLFQTILINALSHERMTPLNSMVNLTEIMIQKCDQFSVSTPRVAVS